MISSRCLKNSASKGEKSLRSFGLSDDYWWRARSAWTYPTIQTNSPTYTHTLRTLGRWIDKALFRDWWFLTLPRSFLLIAPAFLLILPRCSFLLIAPSSSLLLPSHSFLLAPSYVLELPTTAHFISFISFRICKCKCKWFWWFCL